MINLFSYREYPSFPELSDFVKKYWVLDNSLNHTDVSQKSVLPNGCFNIAFIFGQGIDLFNESFRTFLSEGIYLCGQLKTSMDINLRAHSKITLVQLYPWVPSMFTSFPFDSAANTFIPMQELNRQFYGQIKSFDKFDENYIIDYFQHHFFPFVQKNAQSELIRTACQLISGDQLRLSEVADHMGCSTRQLELKFKQHLGLNPKEFSTIMKVRHTADLLAQRKKKESLVQMALENGFYDQAHFTRTFARITQTSPGKFEADNYLMALSGKTQR